jgi:hypothetical protein
VKDDPVETYSIQTAQGYSFSHDRIGRLRRAFLSWISELTTNRTSMSVKLAAETGLKSRNVEKRINAV